MSLIDTWLDSIEQMVKHVKAKRAKTHKVEICSTSTIPPAPNIVVDAPAAKAGETFAQKCEREIGMSKSDYPPKPAPTEQEVTTRTTIVVRSYTRRRRSSSPWPSGIRDLFNPYQ